MVEGTPRSESGESQSLRLGAGPKPAPDFLTMKWLTFFFALFILLIIVLADLGKLGILRVVNQIPYGDKLGHFILYGILTLLLDLTLLRSLHPSNRCLLVFRIALILALIIGLEEFSQQYFPKRTFDLVDLTFSYLGVVFFSWVALKIKRGGVTPPLQ
jgi:hypothetical protein